MDELIVLEGSDPVDRGAVERALADPVFDELFEAIVSNSAEEPSWWPIEVGRQPRRPTRRGWRMPVAAVAAVVVLLGVLVGVGVIGGGGGLRRPFTTSWKAARPLVYTGQEGAATKHGSWHLVDAVLSGTWQQNVYGPPPGIFSCSPSGTCYDLAGRYPSSVATAPLLSQDLYVSTDEGATWTALPVPSGLIPATPLECSGPRWCATGATYKNQPVLAITRDGGHSFTIDPLPTGVGTLHTLSCPSTGVCMGLVSSSLHTQAPVDATLLVTSDGGSTFADEPILTGDSMVGLACTTSTDCTAVGMTDASSHELVPVGVSAVTTDGGHTWTTGSLPRGFDVKFSQLSCADSTHCLLAGFVPIPNTSAKTTVHCASTRASSASTTTFPAMSPQIAAISKTETRLKAAAAAQEAATYHVSGGACQPVTLVSDIASSRDGGLTWTPDVLPTDVPAPNLNGLSCPTATECWAGGQEEVGQKVGSGVDMGSPVLIGTTDGGSTWSKVVFSVPSTAPNATGQSYLSMGSVTCPTKDVCLSRGIAAKGSRYAPVYSLVAPGS
jgi:photosystem II stability/assembly factor-like uncharacterized protein